MTFLIDQGSTRPAIVRIPALIKRNMALFALSQSFTGAGMQFAYGLGPLMVIGLTGSASLAGLSVSLIGFSRFLVSYPIGKITDTYGRKPGILLGLVLALMGFGSPRPFIDVPKSSAVYPRHARFCDGDVWGAAASRRRD